MERSFIENEDFIFVDADKSNTAYLDWTNNKGYSDREFPFKKNVVIKSSRPYEIPEWLIDPADRNLYEDFVRCHHISYLLEH